MRRFVTLVFLFLVTIPFGVSISGCSHGAAVSYCSGGDSGVPVGQVTAITLSPAIYGVSLNQAQILQGPTPSAVDCNGDKETVSHYTYAIFLANGQPSMNIADVNPTTGTLCGGTWNRNTGGGIADYTTCNPTGNQGTVYLVASGSGASSNPLPIFVHPVVTSVQLGTLSTDCTNDPATNCSPAAFTNTGETCTVLSNGCCSVPVPSTASTVSSADGCVSQGITSQLAARVTDASGANISCVVGHLSYAAQTSSVVTIDQNGVATAQQPGSTVITATASNAGSSAGYFSTCPPQTLAVSFPTGTNGSTTSATVNPNNPQAINVTAIDKNGVLLTGLSYTMESTTPTTIPASAPTTTPIFPGAADLFAVCQPPTCNPSPINQIGLFGNGKPVTSNAVSITAPGIQATKIYVGSTASRYVVPYDFSIGTPAGQPVQLPYTPNSMMITNDGNTIYMGSQFALMTFSAATNTVTGADTTARGSVIGLSPDGSTLVISDPSYPAVYLYNTKTFGSTRYPGIGTHAQFSPDSTTVYITLGDIDASGTPGTMYDGCPTGDVPIETQCIKPNANSIVYSSFNPTTYGTAAQTVSDVAVAVPSVGAFFAGSATTARAVCAQTTVIPGPTASESTTTNVYYPDAGVTGAAVERITATNDGLHILGATSIGGSTFIDQTLSTAGAAGAAATPGLPAGECPHDTLGNSLPLSFGVATAFTGALPGVTATHITGVYPTSDSKIAFITFQTAQTSLGILPAYIPQATGAGALSNITLSTAIGTPIAPLNGVVSADNQTFYTGTSGDNAIHLITKQSDGTYKDTTTPLLPKLTDPNNNVVAPNLLVQKPRAATS